MIHIECDCGEIYHADESHVGKAIKCRICGRLLRIELPAPVPPHPESQFDPGSRHGPTAPVRRAAGLKWIVVALVLIPLIIAIHGYVQPYFADRTFASQPAPRPASTSTPQPRGRQLSDVVLPTGTELWSSEHAGLGELVVENGTEFDGLVKLVNQRTMRTERLVFINSGHIATISGIAPGTYILRYGLGYDLVRFSGTFSRPAVYGEFEQHLVYTETKGAQGTDYWVLEVTLHAVPGGTARTEDIAEDTFTATDDVHLPGRDL